MPNKKISELTEVALVVGTNVIPIVDGGVTKKAQLNTLKNFLINDQGSVNQLSAVLDSVYSSVSNASASWDSVYSSVANTSANWDSVYSSVANTSADWDSVYSSVSLLSTNWNSVYSSVANTSANWDSVYSSVANTSANWDSVYASVASTSANWDSVYSSVTSTSANWDSVYSSVANTSANWDSVYSSVKDISANWDSVYSSVELTSANWDSVYSSVANTSADWDSGYSSVSNTSASWDSVYSSVANTSADWNAAYTNLVSNSATYLSGLNLSFVAAASANWDSVYSSVRLTSADWNSVYSSVANTSANWDSVYSSVSLTSANWDSVYSSVASTSADWNSVYSNVKATSSNYLLTDFSNISSTTRINSNITIFGDLSCTGTQTFANTVFATTSALSVVHIGVGPAVYIGNNGSGDIASFYDIDQDVEILHVGGINSTSPNVGVKTSNPNKTFTVNGEISANGVIWDSTGNSNQWNSVYSSVANTSADWDIVYSSVKDVSANWNSVYTDVGTASANWDSVYSSVKSVSANWNSVYSSVKDVSANWDTVYSSVKDVSANWNSVYTDVGTASANWDSVYSSVKDVSANWDSVYSSVSLTSANWNSVYSSVKDVSANWDTVYSSVANTSADWDSVYSNVRSASANWDSAYSSAQNLSANNAHYFVTCRVSNNQTGTMNTAVTPNTFTYTATGSLGTFDGVTVAVGDTILFAGQTTPSQSGPWRVVNLGGVGVSAVFERPNYFSGIIKFGMFFSVSKGTSFQGNVYSMFPSPPGTSDITVGTTNLYFGICFTRGANNVTNSTNTYSGTQILAAGSTTTAPLRFQAGTVLNTPVAHSVEWDGTSIYATNSSVNRKPLLYSDFSNVSSGPVNLPDRLTAGTATFTTSVSSLSVSGTHYGDGGNLTGITMGSRYEILENFIGGTPLAGGLSPTSIGSGSGTNLTLTNLSAGFIGLVQLKTGTAQAVSAQQGYRANNAQNWSIRMVGYGQIVYATRFAQIGTSWFGTGLEAGVLRLGLTDNALPGAGSEVTSGIFFRSKNGTAVELVCRQANVESTLAMGTVSNGVYNAYKYVVNAAGTSVEGFLNGVSQGSITTNIPSATGLGLVVQFYRDIVASPYTTTDVTANLDFYYFSVNPTTSYI